jgi:hypothetical protein
MNEGTQNAHIYLATLCSCIVIIPLQKMSLSTNLEHDSEDTPIVEEALDQTRIQTHKQQLAVGINEGL